MLFCKAKKLDWQHIALIGVVSAAVMLLILAILSILSPYVLNFIYQNGFLFLYSWTTESLMLLGVVSLLFVAFGPALYHSCRHKKPEYGMKIIFSTLVMTLLLLLVVIAVVYVLAQTGVINAVSYEDLSGVVK